MFCADSLSDFFLKHTNQDGELFMVVKEFKNNFGGNVVGEISDQGHGVPGREFLFQKITEQPMDGFSFKILGQFIVQVAVNFRNKKFPFQIEQSCC